MKKKYKNIFLISSNSDIAIELIKHYKKKNWNIYGTYRSKNTDLFNFAPKLNFLKVDLKNINRNKLKAFIKKIPKIDVFTCLSQTQFPFGNFFSNKFSEWRKAFDVNMIGPIEIFQMFKKKFHSKSSVIFFSGGGPNKATKNYSAYALSKFSIIRFVELISKENKFLKIACINPGWVNTKAHLTFLKQKKLRNTSDYKKLEKKIKNNDFVDVILTIKFFNWFIKSKKKLVTGKYFVADFDQFGTHKFKNLLSKENFLKMRRVEK